MPSARTWLSRVWDVRPGEVRTTALAFVVLLLVISAHTILETTRDALLLTRLPARELGLVYIGVAVFALPGAAVAGRASRRFGPRDALVVTLIAAATLAVVFFVLPSSRSAVIALYISSALIATAVIPLFWTLLGASLTVAQARRLFAPIASAGVLGGVLGSGAAAAAIPWIPVKGLLLGSGVVFLVAAGAVMFFPTLERSALPAAQPPRAGVSVTELRQEPFLLRVGLVVALSTAAVLAVDYFFKWTVAQRVAPAHVALFVARFYAALNVASLVVQLLFGAALVRKVGLAAAIVVTPLLLVFGALGVLVFGGAMLAVLTMKGIDGSLRYSIHRITTELLYLPVSPAMRARAKPLIDGAVVRAVQAITAALLLALGGTAFLSPRLFAAIVVVLGMAWAASAFGIHGAYLNLLRDVVSIGTFDRTVTPDPLDLASAEFLVEFLSSGDPMEVLAAMNTLVRRGHARLIPGLVLYHDDERVLDRSLEIFRTSSRADWVALARRLLAHPSETLRMAVARALATRGRLDIERLASDESPRVRGYAALQLALDDRATNLANDPRIAAVLTLPAGAGESARLGLLAAIADAPDGPSLADLLLHLAEHEPSGDTVEWINLTARGAARHGDERIVPFLIRRLSTREGRESVQKALTALGGPAFEQVWRAQCDITSDRRLRAQLPSTLALFGTELAAERLLERIEVEPDGLVRYKSIRALGRLVVVAGVRVSRQRVETLARANLVEHLQILGRRVALEARGEDAGQETGRVVAMTGRLLRGLLDDKLRHSLERTFRLLKIAHPREDIHGVYIASQSTDRRARANAAELLDALLTRRDEQPLRALLRIVGDDIAPAERTARSASLIGVTPPSTHDAALLQLIDDHDLAVAALAALYATALGTPSLQTSVEAARARRGEIELTAARWFEGPVSAPGSEETAHG